MRRRRALHTTASARTEAARWRALLRRVMPELEAALRAKLDEIPNPAEALRELAAQAGLTLGSEDHVYLDTLAAYCAQPVTPTEPA